MDTIRQKILELLSSSAKEEEVEHAKNTEEWVLQIKPNASEELRIAALAHDIDRAVPPVTRRRDGEDYKIFKRRHAARSARIIHDLLIERGFSPTKASNVKKLVELHEEGGFLDADILRDADSISYFDTNLPFYAVREARETTLRKIAFMFERASPRAKHLIRSMCIDDALRPMLEEAGVYDSSTKK